MMNVRGGGKHGTLINKKKNEGGGGVRTAVAKTDGPPRWPTAPERANVHLRTQRGGSREMGRSRYLRTAQTHI